MVPDQEPRIVTMTVAAVTRLAPRDPVARWA